MLSTVAETIKMSHLTLSEDQHQEKKAREKRSSNDCRARSSSRCPQYMSSFLPLLSPLSPPSALSLRSLSLLILIYNQLFHWGNMGSNVKVVEPARVPS